MPEISDERLAELEALETVVKRFVLPRAKHAGIDAERERVWKYPLELTDEEARKLVQGSAMWDDPPKGWGPKKLADWTRGYLMGRETVGMNLSQQLYYIIQALKDPVGFWKRQQLGYLELCSGAECSCGGYYTVDEKQLSLQCNTCHVFFTCDQVHEIEKKQERIAEKAEQRRQEETNHA